MRGLAERHTFTSSSLADVLDREGSAGKGCPEDFHHLEGSAVKGCSGTSRITGSGGEWQRMLPESLLPLKERTQNLSSSQTNVVWIWVNGTT